MVKEIEAVFRDIDLMKSIVNANPKTEVCCGGKWCAVISQDMRVYLFYVGFSPGVGCLFSS